jgi:uncharacterized protein YqeY
MGLTDQVRKDMVKAAKERDSLALSALRMALAAIKNKEIEVRGELPDEAVVKVLTTMVKQRREAIDLYLKGNRPELAEKEEAEIAVIRKYLPQGLSEAELESLARASIAATGAKGPADMGRVMKDLMPKVAGRADGKALSELVRHLLSG